MKQLLFLLLTGILALSLSIYLFHRSRAARAEDQADQGTEVMIEAQNGRDEKETSIIYEPPPMELLRLRSEVARLREEATKFEALWQSETNKNTEMRRRLLQLEREVVALQRQERALQQQISVAQGVRRTGPWVGLAVNDATDYEEGVSREGVRVVQVVPQGPAIGLLKSGDVITAVDGRPISDTASFLKLLVTYPAGTTFQFDIVRKDVSSSVTVTSQQWPE